LLLFALQTRGVVFEQGSEGSVMSFKPSGRAGQQISLSA
jgi:hypothetical protein